MNPTSPSSPGPTGLTDDHQDVTPPVLESIKGNDVNLYNL